MTALAYRTEPPRRQSTDDLLTLARQVERLAPSHRDPERFHEAKSEIAHQLRQLAHSLKVRA